MKDTEAKRQRLLRTDEYAPGSEDRFVFGGRRFTPKEIEEKLRGFLTEERADRIEDVLAGRTRTVAPVVEGLVNMGNVSAVMRSGEALGMQSFHVITDGQSFKNSKRTSQGAEKWLDVHLWDGPSDCVAYLREHGYRVVATHLSDDAVPIDRIDFTRRTAVVFGNERDGLSEEMIALADERMVIPMVGFVQSFNISVAAAVTLHHAYRDRLDRQGFHGDLSSEEFEELRAVFYLRSVNRAEEILTRTARPHEPPDG